MRQSKCLSAYKLSFCKAGSFVQTSLDKSNHNSRDYSKYTYSTPVKPKMISTLVCDDNKSPYSEFEVNQFLSCIIQLKDHISYMNILFGNLLEKMYLFQENLQGSFVNKVPMENIIEEVDVSMSSIWEMIHEAFNRNTDAIEKFANITGREFGESFATRASEKHIGSFAKSTEKTYKKAYLEKLKQISRIRKDKKKYEESKEDSLDYNIKEYKILKQENKYLKGVINTLKSKNSQKGNENDELEDQCISHRKNRKLTEELKNHIAQL